MGKLLLRVCYLLEGTVLSTILILLFSFNSELLINILIKISSEKFFKNDKIFRKRRKSEKNKKNENFPSMRNYR